MTNFIYFILLILKKKHDDQSRILKIVKKNLNVAWPGLVKILQDKWLSVFSDL